MTPEAQRIAIAEACGVNLFVIHKPIHDPFGYYRENAHGYTSNLSDAWKVPWDVARKHITGPAYANEPDRVVAEPAPLPDYLRDLNAMHIAEKTLAPIKITRYISEIWCAMCRVGEADCMNIGAIHATADQRAEAFLRTIGKWDDSK